MKVWITKYALSKGIFAQEVTPCQFMNSGRVFYVPEGRPEWQREYANGEGKEWHRTRESAIARAEEMRTAKIASLKKQIAKLEKMEFKA